MVRKTLILGAFAVYACGPVDQSGTASGGPSGHGGPVAGADGGIMTGGGADGGSAPTAGCGGIMPADLGGAITVTMPHGDGDVCWNATGDLAGNVAAEAHRGSSGASWKGTWQTWGTMGNPRGSFSNVGGDLFGQQEGFQSTQGSSHVVWSTDGQALHRSDLDDKCAPEAFYASTGGALVLERCSSKLTARRFDPGGAQVAMAEIGKGSSAAGVIDAQDRALIIVAQGGSYSGRWYDRNLSAISESFTLGARGGSEPAVRPLAAGGAAIQIDGSWAAMVRSGVGAADAVAPWLSSHDKYDLQIIRQGRGYALIPRAGASPHDTLELYSAAGERCGALKFPADGLSMGPDGTVIGSSGDGGCTHPFWSGLLR